MVVLCRIVSTGVWEVVSEKIEGSSLRTHLGMRTHPCFSLRTKAVQEHQVSVPLPAKGRPKSKVCILIYKVLPVILKGLYGLACGSDGKASAYNAGDPDSIPGSERSSGEGNGNPFQYPCLENPMDGGALQAVHEVTKSRTRLSNFNSLLHFYYRFLLNLTLFFFLLTLLLIYSHFLWL